MKKYALIIILIIAVNTLFGQFANKSYFGLTSKADSLYKVKAYLLAAQTYSYAFKTYSSKITKNDLYNAACSWSLCNDRDSAFAELNQSIIKKNFYDLNRITTDTDLTTLHNDRRWLPLIDQIKKNRQKMESKLNVSLVKILDHVFFTDQDDRLKMDTIQNEFGYKSKQMDSLMTDMRYKDSLNLVRVKSIIDKYGWPGPETIGEKGDLTLFLVIQHSEIEVQENYLSLVREAVKDGKLKASSLALLEDRIALRHGKKQIYGSQVEEDPKTGKYNFFPIEDEVNVDNRREEMGLGPLKDYARYFNIDYKLPSR